MIVTNAFIKKYGRDQDPKRHQDIVTPIPQMTAIYMNMPLVKKCRSND